MSQWERATLVRADSCGFTNAWIQLRQMQGYSARLSPPLTPSLCLRCAYARFSRPRLREPPQRRSPEGMPGRLTRVLFDYYFGTYRALVVSLCGHMAVRGRLRWRWRICLHTRRFWTLGGPASQDCLTICLRGGAHLGRKKIAGFV